MVGEIDMNENIDLTKILYGCPVETVFYSSIFGDVKFVGINSGVYPITMKTCKGDLVYLTKDGKFLHDYIGECTLFPSKHQRDWSKFERFWDKLKAKKFDPKTFQPFDKVLAKDYAKDVWTACLYSHHATELDDGWFVCDNTYWRFIIPYNDETKHLVGTKDDCPEYYKWWEE